MSGRFVSEALKPVGATFDLRRMASGEPGLPREFTWREGTIRIASIVREWRETGPCTHGSGERYARKHWYEVADEAGRTLKIYFERKPRGGKPAERWRLFSIDDAPRTDPP